MVFKCQEDSFLTEFETKVVACDKTPNGFDIVLEDTILFPEGGGQPCDHGFINDVPIKQIVRQGDKAVHLASSPFNIGDVVKQKVDWDRRFDHMQQHSGQHLISAIFDRENITTVSWWLGEDISFVELQTPTLSQDLVNKVESTCNELIRAKKRVWVEVFNENTPEELLKETRSVRGLPADHKGDIRVINIEDVEGNMCCGTHVTNLCQLQVIKLLHFEKSKRKGNTNLYFLIGNRAIKKLSDCIKREQDLTSLLKCNPVQHVEMVDKLQKHKKLVMKKLQNVLKELAVLEVNKLKSINPPPKYYCYHNKNAEADFMNIFVREYDQDTFLFLATGEADSGNILLCGDPNVISDLGSKLAEILSGKGNGKGNQFQAKCTKMANIDKAQKLVEDYFKV